MGVGVTVSLLVVGASSVAVGRMAVRLMMIGAVGVNGVRGMDMGLGVVHGTGTASVRIGHDRVRRVRTSSTTPDLGGECGGSGGPRSGPAQRGKEREQALDRPGRPSARRTRSVGARQPFQAEDSLIEYHGPDG
jgi:hypothetical protein